MGWRGDPKSIIDGDVGKRSHKELSPVPDNEVGVRKVPITVLSVTRHPFGLPPEEEPLPELASEDLTQVFLDSEVPGVLALKAREVKSCIAPRVCVFEHKSP